MEQNVWWTLWARLIRSELIKEHNIFPIPGMNMWEDMFVNLRVYYYALKLVHIPEPFYHYDTSRDGSIVAKRLELAVIQQQISCLTHLTAFFEEVGFDASKFLRMRKCAVKSKFLLKEPIDYKAFQKCFPEITNYYNGTHNIYSYCWEKAAIGKTIPFRLLSVYYNVIALLSSKIKSD